MYLASSFTITHADCTVLSMSLTWLYEDHLRRVSSS